MHTRTRIENTLVTLLLSAFALCLCHSCQPPMADGTKPKPTTYVPDDSADGPDTDRRGKNTDRRDKGTDRRHTDNTADKYHPNMRLLEMPQTHQGEIIVRHTGYTLSYNTETNCPNWVAWELTRAEAKARGNRNPDFYADPGIEDRSQVNTRDYSGSGYTRGHMCPSADMRWSKEAQHDCFYMSNMCPQNHELNSKSWEWLEQACRRWAKKEGSVYIVCGPVFNKGRKVRTIGREHKVRVPDGFFKVVLTLRRGEEKAIGFYYANNDRQQTMESAAMTVDELEEMTGYNFFYQVEDHLENHLEAQCNLHDWD